MLQGNWKKSVAPMLIVSLVAVTGCPPAPTDPGTNAQPKLVPFASEREFVDYFRTQASARGQFFGTRDSVLTFGEADAGNSPAPSADDGAGGADFSSTNLQEAGVDESDVFKTDGRYLYVAQSDMLRILDTSAQSGDAAGLAEIANIKLTGHIDSIYLFESTIIALSQNYGAAGGGGRPEILIWPPYYVSASTTITQIDVTSPGEPRQMGRIEIDGSLVSSRLTNERLLLVLTVAPELPSNPTPLGMANITIDRILPKVRRADGATFLANWDRWLRPESPDGYNMTAVVTLNANKIESIMSSVAVMANAGAIYASTSALYLTDADYDSSNDYREYTAIHKFSYDDRGAAQYVASGRIPGRLLNQFSMGEHGDHLRAAVHVQNAQLFFGDDVVGIGVGGGSTGVDVAPPSDRAQQRAPNQPYNAVYVLAEKDGELEVTGSIEDIAPGERIYSARFMGDRGYLVTFEQIDPLFTLDLSNPTRPRVVGELKVPGFSDYLHPVGENHLIGVGRSTETAPWGGTIPRAVQISLFDVSNPAAPVAVDQIEIGGEGSSSDVSYTHKAFTMLRRGDRTILAIPVQLWNAQTGPFGQTAFDGIVSFDVDLASGFTERGRVASIIDERFGWVEWRRAAILGDQIYSLSSMGVRSANLSDFVETNRAQFPPPQNYYGYEPTPVDFGGGAATGNPGRER